jgi:hypothetical protein
MMAMGRAWLGLGIAVLWSGCRHVPHSATPASSALGCFDVKTSAEFSAALPRRIELRPTPSLCPHARDKLWALGPDAAGESRVHGHWSQSSDGSVKILWGDDFHGIAVDVHPAGDEMVGTAKIFRDVGEDGPPGDLLLKRVACGK